MELNKCDCTIGYGEEGITGKYTDMIFDDKKLTLNCPNKNCNRIIRLSKKEICKALVLFENLFEEKKDTKMHGLKLVDGDEDIFYEIIEMLEDESYWIRNHKKGLFLVTLAYWWEKGLEESDEFICVLKEEKKKNE